MNKGFLLAIGVLFATSAQAQSKSPCDDAELLRLKALPKAILTESERKTLNKLNEDCEKVARRAIAQPIGQAEVPKQSEQSDSANVALKEEPFATPRNFAILSAMCAAIASIVIAINSVADSPF